MGFFWENNKSHEKESQARQYEEEQPTVDNFQTETVRDCQEVNPAEGQPEEKQATRPASQPVENNNPSSSTNERNKLGTEEQFSELLKDLKQILERTKVYEEQLDEKEAIIKQQHGQLLKFQEDILYKTQKPLIMELIGIADNIRTILKKQKEEQSYPELLDDIERTLKWVDTTLEDNGVRKFEEAATQGFNSKRQTIVDTQQAATESLANTYITDQPGYEWSLPYLVIKSEVQLQNILRENQAPQKFGFVIRPEEVIKLK